MNKKIRLLQVIPNMGTGGAETGCKHIAEYISSTSEFSSIMTSGGSQLDFISKSVKIFKWPTSKNIFFIIFNIFYILFLISKYKINIVHARSRGPAWSCYFACKLSNTKLVSTFHGTYNFKSDIKKFYNSIMIKSDCVIAGSNFILNHIHSNYNLKINVDLVKRGIDESYFSPSQIQEIEKDNLRKQMGFSDKNFLVLLPGRLTNWKGQKLFIESAILLKKQNQLSNIFFIILGDSQGRIQYENSLRDLIESNKMIDKIRIVKPMQNMPLAYAFSDLIVSASIEPEAFGRVSVEAQSMEKPILSSAIGGSLETIKPEKTGWLFDHNSKEDLAKNIYNISKMSKAALQSLGKEGRKNVIENYTKDKMCLKTLEIYQSLV
jgi:glycosyltransferase involved in cell wall biosynthesis